MPRTKTPKPKQFRVNWKGKFTQVEKSYILLQQEHRLAMHDRSWLLGELHSLGYNIDDTLLGKAYRVCRPPKPWYWGWWPW